MPKSWCTHVGFALTCRRDVSMLVGHTVLLAKIVYIPCLFLGFQSHHSLILFTQLESMGHNKTFCKTYFISHLCHCRYAQKVRKFLEEVFIILRDILPPPQRLLALQVSQYAKKALTGLTNSKVFFYTSSGMVPVLNQHSVPDVLQFATMK